MKKHTSLYESHRHQGGLMVDFAGWELPLHYGSQITEHQQVREDVGIFDVSHMGIVDVEGKDAQGFLRYVLANNIDKLKVPGQALYSCILNEQAGIIDDLIVYYLGRNDYRLVVNAARIEVDIAWLKDHAKRFSVAITLRTDLAILAIQGPNAREKISLIFPSLREKIQGLKSFQFCLTKPLFPTNINYVNNDNDVYKVPRDNNNHSGSENGNDKNKSKNTEIEFGSSTLIARTGYTGEDGLEVILPKTDLTPFWNACIDAKIPPIGLGARDTLRLEVGLNLYGQDMDENVTPFESNLAWTVAMDPKDRDFIGREALNIQQSQGVQKKLVGLILLEKGVLRHGQRVFQGEECVGLVTSGSFSPTLKKSIALARIRSNIQNDCLVEIRNQTLAVKIVQPPFVRRGHAKNTQRT